MEGYTRALFTATASRQRLPLAEPKPDVDGIDLLLNYPRASIGVQLKSTYSLTFNQQGLATRPTPKRPAGPLSRNQLCMMLRNKYYIGILTYEGEEYQGHHEPLISSDLFDRVQDVIDVRSRRGTRERVHKHYLKGLLFCDRCAQAGRTNRLVYSENTNWRGDIYPYYKCLGRQRRGCDLPYLPVAVVENAVVDFYALLHIPDDLAQRLRDNLLTCLQDEQATTRELHANLKKRLRLLSEQEDRLLDLAMAGDLPQGKIRERLAKIEVERTETQAKLGATSSHLALGLAVLQSGVAMLRNPQDLYERAPDDARGQLDRAFFQRLFLDDVGHVTRGVLNEPFTAVLGRVEVVGDDSHTHQDTTKAPEHVEGLRTDTFSLHLDPEVESWSKQVLVAPGRLELPTSGL